VETVLPAIWRANAATRSASPSAIFWDEAGYYIPVAHDLYLTGLAHSTVDGLERSPSAGHGMAPLVWRIFWLSIPAARIAMLAERVFLVGFVSAGASLSQFPSRGAVVALRRFIRLLYAEFSAQVDFLPQASPLGARCIHGGSPLARGALVLTRGPSEGDCGHCAFGAVRMADRGSDCRSRAAQLAPPLGNVPSVSFVHSACR